MGKKRSIVPAFFTMGNMVMGFVSIIFSSRYDPQDGNVDCLVIAGVLIFVASIFDMFDGAVARALDVESELGMQLDSLADAVAYGIAPGILAYHSYLYMFPEKFGILGPGIVIASVYPICAVYRLARFNCEESGQSFTGLPSPAAGVLIGSISAIMVSDQPFFGEVTFVMPLYVYSAVYLFAAYLMVSEFDYRKLFSDLWKKGLAVRVITPTVIILLLVFFKTWSIFVVASAYIIWGLVKNTIDRMKRG
jgi:CDP-diacylglycerol--serine O-phosphatidyltransferase